MEVTFDKCQGFRESSSIRLLATKSPNLSRCQFPHLKKEENSSTTSIALNCSLNVWNEISSWKRNFSAAQQIGRLLKKNRWLLEQGRNLSLSFPEWKFSFISFWSSGCWQSHGLHHWGAKHTWLYSKWENCLSMQPRFSNSIIKRVIPDLEDYTTKSYVFSGHFLWNVFR